MCERMIPCPVAECPEKTAATMFMCREHWFQVPKRLRDAIWTAWKQRQKDPRDLVAIRLHQKAKEEALAAVEHRA